MLKIKRRSKVKTVSDKVNELLLNENSDENAQESGGEESAPRFVDFDEDEYDLPEERSTEFRKKNVKLLSEQSERYRGKIASRKDFEEAEEDQDESEEDEEDRHAKDSGSGSSETEEWNDKSFESFSKKLQHMRSSNGHSGRESDEDGSFNEDEDENFREAGDIDSDLDSVDSKDDDDDDDDDGDDDEDDHEKGDSEDSELSEDDEDADENNIISEENRQAEIQKGFSVQNQLRIWERLLEFRINSQKILNKANQLPDPAELEQQQTESPELKDALKECASRTGTLLTSLLELQRSLWSQNNEMKAAMKQSIKRPLQFGSSNANEGPPLKRYADHLEHSFDQFGTYRNEVLLKWDDRTKLLTPGAGAKKKHPNRDYDILKKIDSTLANQRTTLIRKSQTSKMNGSNNVAVQSEGKEKDNDDDRDDNLNAQHGEEAEDQINPNIYDDSDFYHQQLRELIEYKTNNSDNLSEVTKQYIELQKLRQKMKKKVDTRASKGRKLRYAVHTKLLSFMAPFDESTATYNWTDEAKDELYRSLFAAT